MPTRDPFARLDDLQHFGIKLGLDNPSALAARLGHPERTWPSVHVAGTNGKGSVVAMVTRGLRRQGLRTGTYTSPHLVHLEERFRIDGRSVDRSTLRAALETVLQAMDELVADGTLAAPATFFEVTTLAAFELFRQAKVDVAVVEVGLGGRFDATNIIVPLVAAITSIGFDHEAHLGRTLEAIAGEKAGIVKPDVPIVVGALPKAAEETVRRVCSERGAPVVESARPERVGAPTEATWIWRTPDAVYGPVTLGLRGDHQAANAGVAVAVLETLARRGLPVSVAAIESGLADVEWPGRLQLVSLRASRQLLLDGAHNVDGIVALAAHLGRTYARPLPIVFGVMKDKAAEAMIGPLSAVARTLVCTQVRMGRAMPAAELGGLASKISQRADVVVEPDPARAIARAFALGTPVVVAGSLYLVGHVLGLVESGDLA
ncbi:MAG: folylpolyglutamate synthase/dihydrofolate synthase family protein [Vicinamibacterales bacterium]